MLKLKKKERGIILYPLEGTQHDQSMHGKQALILLHSAASAQRETLEVGNVYLKKKKEIHNSEVQKGG
jgi:hypothetical protein